MRPLTMVALSLLLIGSGLKLYTDAQSNLTTGIVHLTRQYLHKRLHKEILRDSATSNTMGKAVHNSFYFITCALPVKPDNY
jgi:hypothetical protein